MIPLRNKEEIFDYAAKHAPSRACQRAIEGRRCTWEPIGVTVESGDSPYWIVTAISPRGKVWHIKITPNEEGRAYDVEYL